jgi:hypothetical protein
MSTKIEITLERTEAQVSVCSIDPTVIVTRDADISDYDALRAYATALERLDESRVVPA